MGLFGWILYVFCGIFFYFMIELISKKINLSKRVIVYNKITGEINLYGKFYEIDKGEGYELNKDTTYKYIWSGDEEEPEGKKYVLFSKFL